MIMKKTENKAMTKRSIFRCLIAALCLVAITGCSEKNGSDAGVADDIEQIRTICWCGKRAHFNARLLNGEMVTEGEQVQLGGNESYISLCRKHYKQRKIED